MKIVFRFCSTAVIAFFASSSSTYFLGAQRSSKPEGLRSGAVLVQWFNFHKIIESMRSFEKKSYQMWISLMQQRLQYKNCFWETLAVTRDWIHVGDLLSIFYSAPVWSLSLVRSPVNIVLLLQVIHRQV